MPTPQEMRQALKSQQMRLHLKALQQQELANAPAPEVKDEMPEWLSDADRLKAKNLTNNEDEQVAFLQKQYPDAEVKKGSSGQVLLRKKGEDAFGVLDPSFSVGRMFSKEGLRDLGDIAADIGQGAAEAGGAAIGAAGGLPGVMAGSGAAAGAYSSAKEKLAEMLGVKDADYGNAAKDALIGAVMPGVFHGAGKGIKYGAQKLAPKAYAWATSLTPEALSRIAADSAVVNPKNPKKFLAQGDVLSKMDETGALKVLKDAKEGVDNWIGSQKQEFAKKYKQLRGGSESIDLSDVTKHLDDKIAEAADQYNRTGLNTFKEQMDSLQTMKDQILGPNAKSNIGISDAMDLDSRLSNDWIDYADDVGQGVGKGRSVSDVQEQLAKDLRAKLRGAVNKESYGSLQNTSDEYSKFVDQINFLRKNVKDPKKLQATLENLGRGKDISLVGGFQGLDDGLKKTLKQAKGDIDLYRFFKPTNGGNLTEQGLKDMAVGKSNIEKLLTAIGTGAGYVSGGPVGGVLGAGAGRIGGKVIASPKSVLRVAKAGKFTGEQMDALENLLKTHPGILRSLYGTSAAATQD